MTAINLETWHNLWNRFPGRHCDDKAIGVLTQFIQDAEHELLSLVTVLQAHIDLLHAELSANHMPVNRFPVLDSIVARLATVTLLLATVSEQSNDAQPKQTVLLSELLQEITAETQSVFRSSDISLSCNIAQGTKVAVPAGPLKIMIMSLLVTVLRKCQQQGTITVTGMSNKECVSLSIRTAAEATTSRFDQWRLGQLCLIPTNGEGISLSAIDAMARFYRGHLSLSTTSDQQHEYRLLFKR